MSREIGLGAYLGFRSKLKCFVIKIVRSESEAEDVVQDTFLRWLQRDETERVRSPKAFLFATARNLAFDTLRRGKVRSTICGPADQDRLAELASEAPSLEARMIVQQELDLLINAVMQLPPQCRRAFVLKKFHDWSYGEIAAEMGISESTVRSHAANGLHVCQKILSAVNGTAAGKGEP